MLRMDKCRRWRGVMWLASLLLLIPMRGAAIQTTQVQGVVYRADGSLAQGTMLVSWPAFTAADGSAVAAGNTSVTIAADGSVSMALAPNIGANPQGTYYTVVYHMNDGTVQKEYWVVPQAATATISAMRARVVPAAVAQQSVTQQYVDTSISALQGSYLALKGGTMSGVLNLSSDPTNAMQAATKEYVDAHAGSGTVSLPSNAIPFQTSSGLVQAATHANVDALYTSAQYVAGSTLTMSTAFTGTAGTSIVGTEPEIADVPNSAWVLQTGSVSKSKFLPGGGVQFGPAAGTCDNTGIDTGYANEVITLSNVTLTGTDIIWGFRLNAAHSAGDLLEIGANGAVSLVDIGATNTTIATGNIGTTTSGTITITLSGSSVSVNIFGTVLSGNVPTGTGTTENNSFMGSQPCGVAVGPNNTSTISISGMSVTATGAIPNAVACSGYPNSNGACSTPGNNAFAVTDGNGNFTTLAEKGTKTTKAPGAAPVTSIAWQDDFTAGVYDIRDPRWGSQATPALQAVALQNMSNQMACDIAMGKVQQAVAKLPQGSFAVDQLLLAPGSDWEGVAQADGGTIFHTIYYNHYAMEANLTMTVTCSDGQQHTDSAGLTHVSHLTLDGCAEGGCSNAPGDIGNYSTGGPFNAGIWMNTNGIVEHVFAQNFGGLGIKMNGQDDKAFHDRVAGNLQWYYYGGYKGVTESATSAEANATTTGTTGSIALSWPAVTGATGYVIYRGTTSGGESVFYTSNTNSFTDTGTTGAGGSVMNVVTNNLGAPGTITATPSTTGGTLAAATYYYRITATTADGWHGSIELGALDGMADWIEAYGLFDAPNAYTYHHLTDILAGGGYSHYDHLWPQLGLNGIVDPYGAGPDDTYENVRIDFTRLEGFFTNNVNVNVLGGVIDGSCTTPNAVTINTGQSYAQLAGTCNQYVNIGNGGILSNIQFADNAGYGPTYKTADYAAIPGGGPRVTGVTGTVQSTPSMGRWDGSYWSPANTQITGITGPNPSIAGLQAIVPTDSAPTTYSGFYNVSGVGQDFYVGGGDANVTLPNNQYIVTCSGQSINLGSVPGWLHFKVGSAGAYGQPGIVKEVCNSGNASVPPSAVAGSETVTFSATPTFSTAKRASIITLTGNVTSFTLAAGADGQEKTLTFCQNATGGFTVTPPANVHGFLTVGTTASKCSAQHYTYSAAQSAWLADSPGVTNE